MALGEATTHDRLAQFLCGAAGARAVEIAEVRRLSGGAVQENWLVAVAIEGGAIAGRQKLVLRTDAATSLSMSRDRATEFAVQQLVHAGGVTVPEPLVERLAQELAKLHKLRPARDALAGLGAPPADPAAARLRPLARFLEAHGEPHPVAEWGVRWLLRHAPPPATPVLCHGDFRTGNYLADDS